MADLRRWITALAILALFTGLASAQTGGGGGSTLSCSVNTSNTPTLRSEGITEQIGDIVITCTGGTIGDGVAGSQVNITVSLRSQVTSRLISSTSSNASEALLLIDEPTSGTPANPGPVPGYGSNAGFNVCPNPGPTTSTNPGGANNGCVAYAYHVQPGGGTNPVYTIAVNPNTPTSPNAANVYQGIVSGNQVTFYGVPIIPPGTNGARVYRITNVRTNANGIGGGSASGAIPVQASLLTSNPSSLPISNPTPIVGFVQSSLSTSTALAANFGQCVSQTLSQSTILTFSELFGSAWKTRVDPTAPGQVAAAAPGNKGQGNALVQNVPGTIYNSESGFTLTVNGGTAGLADFGTRLRSVFNNIPVGARLFVSMTNVNVSSNFVVSNPASPSAQLVSSDTAAEGSFQTTPFTTLAPGSTGGTIPVVEITPSSGTSATGVWEIIVTNPNALDTLQFAAYVTYVASPGTNSPANGTSTTNLSYAPISTTTTASSGPIPRFIDTSQAKTAFSVNICRTVLLFPFVTNQVGFDTGLAISNTSTDPFGTTPQAGTCALNWYGANSVPVITTPSVATATSYTTLASVAAPNFQGYMIAVCGFQYAHGFAFVSDIGARNLAMGYLALIVPDPNLQSGAKRNASGFDKAPASAGENLGF